MNSSCPQNAEQAARHVKGATIAWGADHYYDFDTPNPEVITLEDAAYALAYTVRWRGQTRFMGQRCFFGVGQHCCIMAEHMRRDGHGAENALAALWHEDDEIVLPDMPGPAKPALPGWKPFAAKQGQAIRERFKIACPDPDLVKRYDIRMLVTERRDLMTWAKGDKWMDATSGNDGAAGFEAFDERIVPVPHPDVAAERFIRMHYQLLRELGR